jgi:cystathionine beta-synthase
MRAINTARRERVEAVEHKDKRVHESILGAVGNTPLVRLGRFAGDAQADVFAKIEFMNPMGSIKDRIARWLVEKAERDGRLRPGMTILEASSGNTAMGLAMVAILKGYKCKMVVRDSITIEKRAFLRALGVDVIEVDHKLPRESPDSYNNIAEHIARAHPEYYFPDQHNNRENNEAHYHSTGPEIWDQMDGRIDYLVCGIGTGGTLSGTAKFLKERDPSIRVVAVDPVGSVLEHYWRTRELGTPSKYLVEGLGDECIVGCVDFDLIDEVIKIKDADAFLTARELARTEALMAGGSSGGAAWAARERARRVGGGARIVTILPDSAFRYGSTVYNDEWLKGKGLLDE